VVVSPELHTAPNLIIITDDLSILLGSGGAAGTNATPGGGVGWGGIGAGRGGEREKELALTLAHLTEVCTRALHADMHCARARILQAQL